MNSHAFTLVSDGSSDVVLCRPLLWILRELGVPGEIQIQWADLSRLPEPPGKLEHKIRTAVEKYPCEVLFIHRDAEGISRNKRMEEISRAAARAFRNHPSPPFVCVVPVRMQEAWALFDVSAIRRAARNPNGTEQIKLPSFSRLESEPDPKTILYQALKKASGLKGRRLRKFNAAASAHRVFEAIEDFSPLLKLSAFQELRKDLSLIIAQPKWDQ